MEIKKKTDSDQRCGGRGITSERRGRVKSRNMYKGPMDKDSGGRIECGRWVGRAGERGEGKMETTILGQQ